MSDKQSSAEQEVSAALKEAALRILNDTCTAVDLAIIAKLIKEGEIS